MAEERELRLVNASPEPTSLITFLFGDKKVRPPAGWVATSHAEYDRYILRGRRSMVAPTKMLEIQQHFQITANYVGDGLPDVPCGTMYQFAERQGEFVSFLCRAVGDAGPYGCIRTAR